MDIEFVTVVRVRAVLLLELLPAVWALVQCHVIVVSGWRDGWRQAASKNYQPTPTLSDSDRMIYNSTPAHVTSA